MLVLFETPAGYAIFKVRNINRYLAHVFELHAERVGYIQMCSALSRLDWPKYMIDKQTYLAYVRKYTNAYIDKYIHAYKHTYIHTCIFITLMYTMYVCIGRFSRFCTESRNITLSH